MHQNWFIRLENILFTIVVTDERMIRQTEGQTNRHFEMPLVHLPVSLGRGTKIKCQKPAVQQTIEETCTKHNILHFFDNYLLSNSAKYK